MDYLELPAIQKEIDYIYHDESFNLWDYLYMGMGLVGDYRVCISVGYKIDYCIQKALQFCAVDQNIIFTHINKVKVGELERCQKFSLS